MIALNGVIDECMFLRNKGKGGSVKLSDNFDNKPELHSYNNQSGISIIDCKFEIEKNNDCSLFFQSQSRLIEVEVKNCIFTGYLSNDSYFIDGKSDSTNEIPNLKLMSCKFSSNSKKALNKKFSNVDVNHQVFNYNEKENRFLNLKLWSFMTVGILCVAVIAALIMKKKNNDMEKTHNISLIKENEEINL